MAQYKDPMAMDSGNPAPSTAVEDTGEDKAETPSENTFWIPGDLLGGKCRAGDIYRVKATADPDEDGDVPVVLVSDEGKDSTPEDSSEDDDKDMRMAFASKGSDQT